MRKLIPLVSFLLASPAWAPRANPTSWLREAGTQSIVEAA